MRSVVRLPLLSALIWVSACSVSAATYEVTFEEGAYAFDPQGKATDVDNKYLARITVRKDGQVVAHDLRGSTLSDAWTFYRHWNVDLGHTRPPTDPDVVAMFDNFRRQTQNLRRTGASLGQTKLADLSSIVEALNHVPVLPSGRYAFVTGLHKGGDSKHGRPYAARLLGGSKEHPFDPRTADALRASLQVGGFLRTLNPNNAQGQHYIADGINVHDGRISADYKDSEGCLTIRPQDWKAFYQALPDPQTWARDKHVGTVVIVRKG